MRLFRDLSNRVFRSPYVQKYIGREGHSFFQKSWKLNLDFENAKKKLRKGFFFWDMCIWRSSNKLFLGRRKYLSSAVTVLTNNPKTLNITKRDFFQLNCFHSDQEIWYRSCHSDLNSVSSRLPRYLSKGCLKRDFWGIYLKKFVGVRKFKNTSAMRVIFF